MLRFLLALLLLATASQAQVLIYKGPVPYTAFPPLVFDEGKLTEYLLVDVTARQGVFVDLYRKGERKQALVSPAAPLAIQTFNLTSKKQGTAIIYGGSTLQHTDTAFQGLLTHLYGANAEVPYARTPERLTTTFPRTLKIYSRLVQPDLALTAKGTLEFQAALTQRENDAAHTLAQATEALLTDLQAQGYEITR